MIVATSKSRQSLFVGGIALLLYSLQQSNKREVKRYNVRFMAHRESNERDLSRK